MSKVREVPIEDCYYPMNQELWISILTSRKRGFDIIFVGQATEEIDIRIQNLIRAEGRFDF